MRSSAWARHVIRERYGNLFDMYHKITAENAYKVPMRIFPAVHYTMGGLWVDYNLMSNDPRLVRARRSELLRSRREPPRRQRTDARAWPTVISSCHTPSADTSRRQAGKKVGAGSSRVQERGQTERTARKRLLAIKGKRTVDSFHRELGMLMWDKCGMARNDAGLREAP